MASFWQCEVAWWWLIPLQDAPELADETCRARATSEPQGLRGHALATTNALYIRRLFKIFPAVEKSVEFLRIVIDRWAYIS